MNPESQELIAREWVKAQRPLMGYLRGLLRDYDQVEEVAQRVAVVAVRRAEEYDPERPFVPWLLGIARLEVLKHRRDMARDRHVFDEQFIDMYTRSYGCQADRFKSMEQALELCLRELPQRSRDVLGSRYRRSLSPAEIAEQQNISCDAIRSLLKRTRALLKKCIEHQLGWSSNS